jgi:hypothetical protein
MHPNDTHRIVVLGRTGTGKTQFAVHLLSSRDFTTKPWTVIDYKRDGLINALIKQNDLPIVSPYRDPPTRPGLHVMHPLPHVDDDAMEAWLMKVWEQKNHGLYVDEGYQLPQRAGYDIILTQGRALHIPVISLYQRPVWMSRFAVAQADYFAVFNQNDKRDLKVTQEFMKPYLLDTGQEITVYDDLPKYYCFWYDVNNGETYILRPAPSRVEILMAFQNRLRPKMKAGEFV